MNKGTYGYPLPPNVPTRIAPPEWKNAKLKKLVADLSLDKLMLQDVLTKKF